MEQTSSQRLTQTNNEHWVIASTAAGFSLENMDIMFLSFALAPMIADLHISSAAAGWIGSITNLGMLVGGAAFGLVGDRIGRVKTFSYTIFIFAFATAAMFFVHSLPMVYLFRFLAGIGAGGEYGVGMALIAENFAANRIGRLTSVAAIGGQIGAIFAALAAAVIIPKFGWNALFLLGVIPVILTYFIRRHLSESAVFINAHAKAKANHEKISISRLFASPKLALQTLGLMVMTIVQIAGYFGLMNWLPSIVQKQQGLSVSGSSLWMSMVGYESLDGLKRFCDYFNAVGEKCRAAGIRFGYHNHNGEFRILDGNVILDYMLAHTDADKVFFQIDLYWALVAGADPVDYMEKYPGRFLLWHVKDVEEVGASGKIDFKPIFQKAKTAGLQYVIVEQEAFGQGLTHFSSIAQSLSFLRKAKFVKKSYSK